ncbi:MAG: 50S ribosomal protein L9 [Dehalococcoidales bacterium]|nr:50S ribosomal protein L9 [Dehalococcoidales bacterium]
MKVIFLKDVPKVASAGNIKSVADGYARNFLIPQQLAVAADTSAIKLAETQHRVNAKLEAKNEAMLTKLGQQLAGREITLNAKAGTKGHLYGSITSADIAAELLANTGIEIDKRKIELAESIRQLGSYEATIKLARDITPKIRVNVVEDKEPKPGERK